MGDSRRRPRGVLLVPVLGAAVNVAAVLWANQPWRGGAPALADVVFLVVFCLVVLLPYAAAAFVLVAYRTVGWLWWSALTFAAFACVGTAVIDVSILTSEGSTAGIAFLFLPVYQLACLVPAVVIGGLVAWRTIRRSNKLG